MVASFCKQKNKRENREFKLGERGRVKRQIIQEKKERSKKREREFDRAREK